MNTPRAFNTGNPVVASAPPMKKQAVANYLAAILGHLCVKLLWRSALAHASEVKGELAVFGLILLVIVLFMIDVHIQVSFQNVVMPTTGSGAAGTNKAGGGAALVVAYIIHCIPFANSILDVSKIVVWVNFVFNVGCVMEMRWGLFQKVVNKIAGGEEDEETRN
ncbi:hypothetical protein J7T55_008937 [Diaporthe amygdali]|uniref:uncharacterized protein n=1 Tax=Phomopsis amygdali TaxID=1214568 RepID=UPI0022FEAD19|nr:uncharacterized protein J7T55_008937 [Diaporthe amygdali]KAJ0121770.1 hypothetical protein J7T55_008937 [Diaporthe amygdali]